MNKIDDFLSTKPYSKNTIDRYSRILRDFINVPDLEHLTARNLLNYVEIEKWGNNQRCLAMTTCKQYLKFVYGESHPALTARIKHRRSKPQRTLTPKQTINLLSYFQPTVKGKRDLAIAALAIDTGLRLNELCSLRLADYHPDTLSLAVIIKGGEWAEGLFCEQTAFFIDTWLNVRPTGSNTLFCNTRSGKSLTREGLQTIVKKWGKDLGMKLSPHDFRRTFATLATRFGGPGRVVQLGGRWSSQDMLSLYTRALDQEAIRPYLPIMNLLKG